MPYLGSPAVELVELDLQDDLSIEALIKEVKEKIWHYRYIDRQIMVNLGGLIKLTKRLLPCLGELIINILSSSGKQVILSLQPIALSNLLFAYLPKPWQLSLRSR